ncbi:MAG: 50S ribosome-binding GTPase, partial [Candidatus Heimdallarchaeota archaeon]|nr:50S ribosome-binding GTPase [Candidatus Heimdallarchaeota archaeon]MCK5144657.1 50S ribosome-binding GTPase [Candidatus Heimdallarchaeota archaeon]
MPKQCPHCGKRSRFHRHRSRVIKPEDRLTKGFKHPKRYGRGFRKDFNDHSIEHKVAFLGNPNVGKSSLFNILSGSHVHVGNWPGKTVEKKEGHFILSDEYFSLVDLPGAYSLSARSEEELVTRHFIVDEQPDLICVIADATRLERTLFIALQ